MLGFVTSDEKDVPDEVMTRSHKSELSFPQGCTFVACFVRNCSSYVHHGRDAEHVADSRIMLMYCRSSWALLGNFF